ncbi:MAG: zinc metallopeptidase [Aestuariivirga sp.]|uniref:KPN_02809 family neutral zinc metallopeptidase n=1 Tax=Aestuariivirga sp. TaxID=2650926 RepID=UPI0025C0A9BE|nr:neutral zinc metallopeptidase [Aestuariivirga sp.]MCA3562301.1 zinc metallopeptidase [Aestuariivirga sp.]
MKLDDFRSQDNIEDRRGQGGGFGFPGGGGRGVNIPIGMGRGGFSFRTILILIALYLIFKFVFGLDLLQVLNGGGSFGPTTGGYENTTTPGTQAGSATSGSSPGQASSNVTGDAGKEFAGAVLKSTQVFWTDYFKQHGAAYQAPQLVLFNGFVQSACGTAQSAMGPFYCPGDRKVYIDLSFYQDLRDKLGAPGDFAQGYVIAHEVGHHVQNLLGTASKVQAQRSRVSQAQANELSVRMELQADCYAGMWGKFMQDTHHLDPGDMEEGLQAASAIGDDRLQKRSQGYVVPESFTHGSSAQRMKWLKRGLSTGDIDACDTFSVNNL